MLRDSLPPGRRPFPWVAVALGASVAATAVVTGTLVRELPGATAAAGSFGWPAMVAGRWWTLFTSFVLTRNWFMAVTMPPALLLALVPYERRAGHLRTLVVAALGHVTGSVLIGLAVGGLFWTHSPVLVRAAQNLDYGGSMAVAAGAGALASRVGDRRLVALAFTIVVLLVPLHHQMADWGHLVALPAGFAADRVRRPLPALGWLAVATAGTVALTWVGPAAELAAARDVRFAHPTPHRSAIQRVMTVQYTSPALGSRPETATVVVPRHPRPGPHPVVVLLSDVPGVGRDWVDGGGLLPALRQAGLGQAVAVLPTIDPFRAPTAGWLDVKGQRPLDGVRGALLDATAHRLPLDLRQGAVVVVGAGKGAAGAEALATMDPRVGAVVTMGGDAEGMAATNLHVQGTSWSQWRSALPGALRWAHQAVTPGAPR